MGLLAFEKQLLGHWEEQLKEGEKFTIRRHQCMRCDNVLALQLGRTLDEQSQADYYVVNGCIWTRGEPDLLYEKKRWFGNFVVCPVCGREGKLPMDKPLNWELMQETKEGRNAG